MSALIYWYFHQFLDYFFSFRDLHPIIGEALYLSVEPEFGNAGNHKSRSGRFVDAAIESPSFLLSSPGNQPRLGTGPKPASKLRFFLLLNAKEKARLARLAALFQ